jgi:hypothetical protein
MLQPITRECTALLLGKRCNEKLVNSPSTVSPPGSVVSLHLRVTFVVLLYYPEHGTEFCRRLFPLFKVRNIFSEGILVWSDHSGKVHSVTASYSGCLRFESSHAKRAHFFISFTLQNYNWTKYNIDLNLISSEKYETVCFIYEI